VETRKVAKTHQNILVFFKGDPTQIKTEFPAIEMSADEEKALKGIIEAYAPKENAETSAQPDNEALDF
jgi:hypothetical protein